jgi:cholesterol oxidase
MDLDRSAVSPGAGRLGPPRAPSPGRERPGPRPPIRALRTGPPDVYAVTTDDGVALRLTRYRGGDKGPVIMAHGLGVSSRIFTTDTIDTNLVEYLWERGFDVWLLDLRVSTDLPSCRQRSDADDLAFYDWPAAVAEVLRLTGATDLQVMAHCYGSTTFLMAMLAGMEGVRSAVCSQATLHFRGGFLSRVKARLHVPTILDLLGVETLMPGSEDDGRAIAGDGHWMSPVIDLAARLQAAGERGSCMSPVCRRVSFLYSSLYEHDQLGEATHERIHELFGEANIAAFRHVIRIMRQGHLVNTRGRDVYLPHMNRLAIPITFIHGERNGCYLPEGSLETVRLLGDANGPERYRRVVVPGYGHLDCIFGRKAAEDVFPIIAAGLDAPGGRKGPANGDP